MTSHENCHHLLSSLSEFVDGDLDPILCDEIERHMAGCDNCQIVINTLKKTVELYRQTAETPSIPSDVRTRLFHVLNLEEFVDTPGEDAKAI
jgi:anti-sigma factor RsiW